MKGSVIKVGVIGAGFMGAMHARVRLTGMKEIEVQVNASAGEAGEAVKIGIRPEHMQLCQVAEGLLTGHIQHIEHLGEAAWFYVAVEGFEPLVVRHAEERELALGDEVGLRIPTHHAHLFNHLGVAFRRTAPAVQKQFAPV